MRSYRIARSAYLRSPDERPVWLHTTTGDLFDTLRTYRIELRALLS